MIRANSLLWLCVLLAFSSVTCAPVGEPRRREFLSSKGPGDGKKAKPPVPVPRTLKTRIEAAIKNIQSRQILTTNSFWTVLHGILGQGPETATLTDADTG